MGLDRGGRIGVGAWMLVSTAVRLPTAMAPLLLMFVVHAKVGSYDLGSLAVGFFVLGELGGAVAAGFAARRSSVRTSLCVSFALSALSFSGLLAYSSIPLTAVFSLAFLAGATSATAPGAMQALLLRAVPEEAVARVLSVVRIQSTAVFMGGPALVSALDSQSDVRPALVLCAASLALGAAGMRILREPPSTTSALSRRAGLLAIARAWPIYLSGLAATFVIGVGDLLLSPLLTQRGVSTRWAGLILGVLFAMSLVGSSVYGRRSSWPGTYRQQSLTVTGVMVGGLVCCALVPNVFGIVGGLFLAGSGVAVLLMIRTLALRAMLPEALHASAFSFNYSISCISYILCAAIGGTALSATSASTSLLICAAAVLVASGIGAAYEDDPSETSAVPVRAN